VLPDIVRTLGNVMMDVAVTTTVSRQAGETQDEEPPNRRSEPDEPA
jgi:Na+/H+-dicarboxylate symporter